MVKRHRNGLAVVGAALVAALGVGGVAAAQNTASKAPRAATPTQPAPADTTQSGDQTTPDAPGTPAESATETPGTGAEAPGKETSSETAGDGPGGHADAPGDANADNQFEGVQ